MPATAVDYSHQTRPQSWITTPVSAGVYNMNRYQNPRNRSRQYSRLCNIFQQYTISCTRGFPTSPQLSQQYTMQWCAPAGLDSQQDARRRQPQLQSSAVLQQPAPRTQDLPVAPPAAEHKQPRRQLSAEQIAVKAEENHRLAALPGKQLASPGHMQCVIPLLHKPELLR